MRVITFFLNLSVIDIALDHFPELEKKNFEDFVTKWFESKI